MAKTPAASPETRKKRPYCYPVVLSFALAMLVMGIGAASSRAADNTLVFYRIGEGGEGAWSQLKQYFEDKGYGVNILRGEAAVEKHVEKINMINRGPGKVFIALQLIPGERSRVMVAAPEGKKGEGRFLTIDEIPGEFKQESERLAESIAGAFQVKARRLPLFPLLGVHMPGIMISMEMKEAEIKDTVSKLGTGVEKYLRERTKK